MQSEKIIFNILMEEKTQEDRVPRARGGLNETLVPSFLFLLSGSLQKKVFRSPDPVNQSSFDTPETKALAHL